MIVKKKGSNVKEFLKVINTCKLSESVVVGYLDKVKLLESVESENLLKYSKMMLLENKLYRLMPYISVHLDEINPLKYFEDIGSYEVLCGICNGLKSLHLMNMYHGNLKPSNIFIDEDGKVKLSDYFENDLYIGKEGEKGISRNDDLSFISYEEITGVEISKESDIWCFGCIFYYILSGNLIFKCKSPLETMLNIRECKYKKIENEFCDELNGLLSKMLKVDLKDRLSIDEILVELKRINDPIYLPEVIVLSEEEEDMEGLDDKLSINIKLI